MFVDDLIIFIKYVGGLHKNIQELKLFKVRDIGDVRMKPMEIEVKK